MFAPLYLTLDDICHGLFKYPIIIISASSACVRPKAGGLNKYQIKYFILRGHCGGRFGMWTKSSSTSTLSHRKLHSTSPQYDRFPRPFPTSNDKQTNPTESVSDPTMRTAFQNCVTIVRIVCPMPRTVPPLISRYTMSPSMPKMDPSPSTARRKMEKGSVQARKHPHHQTRKLPLRARCVHHESLDFIGK